MTPVTLYLWLGKEIDKVIKTGSLHILKAFCNHFEKMTEKFQSQASYLQTLKYNENLKLRIEFPGYESQHFLNYLGKQKHVCCNDDILSYQMLRRPKQAHWVDLKE